MDFQLQHQSFQRIFRTDFLSIFLAISLRITLLSAVLSFGLRSEWRSLGPFPLCRCVSLLRPLLPFSWAHLCCLRTGLHSTCSTSRAWSYAGSHAGLARMLEKGQARPRCWRVPGSDPSPRGPDCRRVPRPAAPLPTRLRDPRASRLQSCSIRALPTLGDGPALSPVWCSPPLATARLSPVWCSPSLAMAWLSLRSGVLVGVKPHPPVWTWRPAALDHPCTATRPPPAPEMKPHRCVSGSQR